MSATSAEGEPEHRELPSWRECFAFPLSTPQARRDVFTGGALLFLLLIGWVFNLGHRLDVVYRVYHDEPPYYRGFAPWGHTFLRGLRAFTAIATYLSPSVLLGGFTWWLQHSGHTPVSLVTGILAACCFVLAVYVLPGGMTYNAAFHDISYLYRPDKAFRRAVAGGRAYVWAWLIALTAVSLSFLGLLAGGIGFFFTSVWAWSVVGFAFSNAGWMRKS